MQRHILGVDLVAPVVHCTRSHPRRPVAVHDQNEVGPHRVSVLISLRGVSPPMARVILSKEMFATLICENVTAHRRQVRIE